MKLRLVKNGIFPITKDISGNPIQDQPNTGFNATGTIQGEGKLIGIPSLFIRLAGCNLRCSWKAFDGSIDFCDTPYSSHHIDDYDEMEVEEIISIVKQNLNGIRHIILSGGEPTLQNLPVADLAKQLKQLGLHITMETNGILFFPHIARHIDLFSISPKLKASVPDKEKIRLMKDPIPDFLAEQHKAIRKNLVSIQKYINSCYIKDTYYSDLPDAPMKKSPDKDFQLKFVVSNHEEDKEIIEDYLNHLYNWEQEDILIMPLGSTRSFLQKTDKIALEIALKNRWRYCPRTHIDLFDNLQYV